MHKEFTHTFQHLLQLSGKTLYVVAQHGGLDPAYVSALHAGTKYNPGYAQILKLHTGLIYDPALYERLATLQKLHQAYPLVPLLGALHTDKLREAVTRLGTDAPK